MRNLIPYRQARGPTTRRAATPCTRLPFTPVPPAPPVAPMARVVRPYVMHKRRRPVAVDQSLLGLEVLLEISRMEAVAA